MFQQYGHHSWVSLKISQHNKPEHKHSLYCDGLIINRSFCFKPLFNSSGLALGELLPVHFRGFNLTLLTLRLNRTTATISFKYNNKLQYLKNKKAKRVATKEKSHTVHFEIGFQQELTAFISSNYSTVE